eukprot:CAMPEP_0168727906 /NCGR_PEP_ID=MMETSP0724-20121128/5413_1 /TAXON_ID=265536 /ORGANISM="Amphiprora sp., Strain CCMP467" /LENGTH=77 /DNA_ID=CAMNT_0008774741 /DNA_START=82 /DNA_END=315 /DNA_ORIENTATION=-
MKTAFALILAAASASAFTVPMASMPPTPPGLAMSSEPDAEEEGGLDLDLGEMFEMFEAADKEEDFDNAIKKVKSEGA